MSESNSPSAGSGQIPRPPDRPLVAEVVPQNELESELKLAPPVERIEVSPTPFPEYVDSGDDEEEDGLPAPSQQFTVRDIMLITFLAAAGFAVLRLCPPAMFAGAMGGIAILGLVVLSVIKPEKIIFHLLWWTILGIYIMASVIAVMTK